MPPVGKAAAVGLPVVRRLSASGAVGDPSLATAGKGAAFARRLADELAGLLREVHDRNAG